MITVSGRRNMDELRRVWHGRDAYPELAGGQARSWDVVIDEVRDMCSPVVRRNIFPPSKSVGVLLPFGRE